MADRRAEERWPLPLLHGEQGDFELEVQELLHDHQLPGTSGTRHRVLPGGVNFFWTPHHALALARGAHHRFDHHRPAQAGSGACQITGVAGVGKAGGAQPQLSGCQVADAVAIHGHGRGPGCGNHADAFRLQFREGINR